MKMRGFYKCGLCGLALLLLTTCCNASRNVPSTIDGVINEDTTQAGTLALADDGEDTDVTNEDTTQEDTLSHYSEFYTKDDENQFDVLTLAYDEDNVDEQQFAEGLLALLDELSDYVSYDNKIYLGQINSPNAWFDEFTTRLISYYDRHYPGNKDMTADEKLNTLFCQTIEKCGSRFGVNGTGKLVPVMGYACDALMHHRYYRHITTANGHSSAEESLLKREFERYIKMQSDLDEFYSTCVNIIYYGGSIQGSYYTYGPWKMHQAHTRLYKKLHEKPTASGITLQSGIERFKRSCQKALDESRDCIEYINNAKYINTEVREGYAQLFNDARQEQKKLYQSVTEWQTAYLDYVKQSGIAIDKAETYAGDMMRQWAVVVDRISDDNAFESETWQCDVP